MNGHVKADLENRIDNLEQAVGEAFQRPMRAISELPTLIADLIDILRGVIEAMGADDE